MSASMSPPQDAGFPRRTLVIAFGAVIGLLGSMVSVGRHLRRV